MEAFSFCCHVYGVGEFFGSNRPFSIIWCVFSSIFKNTLPLCLEDGLSLSRNGIFGGSGGCSSSPTLSSSFDISCEDRCASISLPTCELLSPAYMCGSLGGRLFCSARVWKNSSTIPSDGLIYIPMMWKGWAMLSDDHLPRHCLVRGCWGTINDSGLFYV